MLKEATNFKDIKKKKPSKEMGLTFICPLCKGHGYWNIELDAYGKGRHFQAGCRQCNGWGYVDPNSTNATCIHDWKEVGADELAKKNQRKDPGNLGKLLSQ